MKHKRAVSFYIKSRNVPRDFLALKGVNYDAQLPKFSFCARYPLIGQSSANQGQVTRFMIPWLTDFQATN